VRKCAELQTENVDIVENLTEARMITRDGFGKNCPDILL
jgi:hypothetical protein